MDIKNILKITRNYSQWEVRDKMARVRVRTKCERYSRIVGYLRPLQQWNEGKHAEWQERKLFNVSC